MIEVVAPYLAAGVGILSGLLAWVTGWHRFFAALLGVTLVIAAMTGAMALTTRGWDGVFLAIVAIYLLGGVVVALGTYGVVALVRRLRAQDTGS
jgi:hypothetical protein